MSDRPCHLCRQQGLQLQQRRLECRWVWVCGECYEENDGYFDRDEDEDPEWQSQWDYIADQ